MLLMMSVCVGGWFRVSYSFAAAQRVVLLLEGYEVGEWWWFENSRVCLYYFFIVNDCQFTVSLACLFVGGVPWEGLNDGGVL